MCRYCIWDRILFEVDSLEVSGRDRIRFLGTAVVKVDIVAGRWYRYERLKIWLVLVRKDCRVAESFFL